MVVRRTIVDFGFLRLDGRKKTPLFRQIYDSIRTAILDGQLSPNSRIPSSRELVEQLGVSRTTVMEALDRLVAEGYLRSVGRSGTFVSDDIPGESPFINTSPLASPSFGEEQPVDVSSYLSNGGKRFEKATGLPGHLGVLIPFRPGVPALDEFPIQIWTKIVRKIWNRVSGTDLTYGNPAGYEPLRSSIAEYLRAHRGVRCNPDQVIIVNGTQQAFDVIGRLCLDHGDQFLFENPGYVGARNALSAQGAKVIPMPVDENGAQIRKTVKKHPRAKLVYVTPSNQYPMGATLSIERRMELIDWAGETGGVIVEDDYDSEYRYSQKPIPALQGLDSAQRTFYVGSFSKVIFPALSLGYVVVPQAMVSVFKNALSVCSRPASLVDQLILFDFIEQGHFGRHLRRMRKTHASRRQTFVDEFQKRLSNKLTIAGSEAGLHCVGLLKDGSSDAAACSRLEQAGIVTRSLSQYYLPGTPASKRVNGLVFGFASSTPAKLISAVKKTSSEF